MSFSRCLIGQDMLEQAARLLHGIFAAELTKKSMPDIYDWQVRMRVPYPNVGEVQIVTSSTLTPTPRQRPGILISWVVFSEASASQS